MSEAETTPEAEKDEKKFDVLAVGNAMVDILVKTDDKFLESLGLEKGTMSLIDQEKAKQLFTLFESVEKASDASVNEMSGGSAANVTAGISSFGGTCSFLGKIGKDTTGEHFIEKLKGRNIDLTHSPIVDGGETGRCLIIVTEDGDRTMCTYLGSSQEITKDDIKEEAIASSKVMFLSAFLWDCNSGAETGMAAIELAKKNECKVALALSDALCVGRHKAELLDVVDNHVDILFATDKEINALFETEDHAESVKKMTEKYSGTDKLAVLTTPFEDVIVVNKEDAITVKSEEMKEIVDATGAGALFVSGFLYAHTHDFDLEKSAKLGSMAAAECVGHLGARPLTPLKDLIVKL